MDSRFKESQVDGFRLKPQVGECLFIINFFPDIDLPFFSWAPNVRLQIFSVGFLGGPRE